MNPTSAVLNPQEAELAAIIIETLNLEVAVSEIDPEAPLYGEGLGLDSIDMLEISLVVAQRYGVKLHPRTIQKALQAKAKRGRQT